MLIRKAQPEGIDDILALIKETGASPVVYDLLVKKGLFCSLIIEDIDNRAAAIFKQEALSCGAELVINENISRFKRGNSKALLFATTRQLELLRDKLLQQPFGLKEAAAQIKEIIAAQSKKEKIFRHRSGALNFEKPAVMGIINLDPSSFSGDGLESPDEAARRAKDFQKQGAQIIDIGAESSRPGSSPLDAKTEMKRLIPSLKKIRAAVSIPISIDTYKYETAKAALDEGADIINDISALTKGKEKLAKLIASQKAGVILMHSKGNPKNMQKNPHYKDCTGEVFKYLQERIRFAQTFSIEPHFISIYPGIGFGKTVEHNLELIRNTAVFSQLAFVTVGLSRKSFIRKIAGDDICAFVSANLIAAMRGANIIRVHDVKETVQVLKLL